MKGGRPMSHSSLLPIRPNLNKLFAHCEGVLASAQAPDHAPFSPDELQMICYYANAIAKLADAQRVQGNGKPALR
jgi:hypothetical protein